MEHYLIGPIEISILNDPSIKYYNISTIYTIQTQGVQILSSVAGPQFNSNSPSHEEQSSPLPYSSYSNISMDTPTNLDHVTRYSNNSHGIFQSEVIFEELKVTKLKKYVLDDLGVEIKDIIKKSRISSYQFEMFHKKFH